MIFAAAIATFIGLALGLLGGGGSVLAVPLLIYVAHLSDKAAIATSLVLVAATSAVAASGHVLAANVEWRGALTFAPAAMLGSYLGGRLAQHLPGSLLIGMFAVMMLITAGAMWRERREAPVASVSASRKSWMIAPLGLAVGMVTGLVGAGGGFLVVPALALVVGMPIHRAIGTSLVVITVNSASALIGHLSHVEIDWHLTLAITSTASIGAFIGSKWAARVNAQILRRGFSVLVLAMGLILLTRALSRAFA